MYLTSRTNQEASYVVFDLPHRTGDSIRYFGPLYRTGGIVTQYILEYKI